MSRENVEIVSGLYEWFLRGGGDAALQEGTIPLGEPFDPNVVFDPSEAGILDFDSVYRGRDALAAFWKEWLSAWERIDFDYELLDAGNHVVSLISQRMSGRSTGIEVDFGEYAQLFTFEGRRIVRWKIYRDRAEALEAAGLSDQPAH